MVDESKEQPNRIFLRKELTNKVITDYRTTAAHN